jgi:hypothetical protein
LELLIKTPFVYLFDSSLSQIEERQEIYGWNNLVSCQGNNVANHNRNHHEKHEGRERKIVEDFFNLLKLYGVVSK